MVARFLVTTALEQTWPADDVPVLFLGEWCRLYERKSAWEKRDALVAPYHWDDRKKLHNDYLYLRSLYEELLGALATRLNELHNVDHSVRYWRIIVGPWLGYFIQMLFDRWAMLRQALCDNEISGVRVLSHSDGDLVPNDMAAFVAQYTGDSWNELIYGQVLEWMGVPFERVGAEKVKFDAPRIANSVSPTRRLKRSLASVASYISGAFCRDDEYFFISSYLGIKQDLWLQAKLGQIPKLWRPVAAPVSAFDREARRWLISSNENHDEFATLVRELIPGHIPTTYLEGYQTLVALTESLSWPKSPCVIFTSNSFSTDDVFKAWSAAKVQSGTPMIVGQHGGNYGMARWTYIEEHEIAISDRYLTWGWDEGNETKLEPVGALKNFGNKIVPDNDGVVLMVEMVLPRNSNHMYSTPVASQWMNYFEDQCRFVAALPQDLRDQLLVRLFPEEFGWGQRRRWKDRFPNVQLDGGSLSMYSLMERARICISTYNATTYLESMSLNFPTLMFWNPTHWELRDSAVPYFERLKSAGIYHETPEGAAQQMGKVWRNVAGWWGSSEVQAGRKEFCDRYAYIPKSPLNVMEKLFRRISDDDLIGRNSIMKRQMH